MFTIKALCVYIIIKKTYNNDLNLYEVRDIEFPTSVTGKLKKKIILYDLQECHNFTRYSILCEFWKHEQKIFKFLISIKFSANE